MGCAARFRSPRTHRGWLVTLVLAAFCSCTLATTAAAADPAQKTPLEDYDETVQKGDSLFADGNYRDAVLAYERAWRVAYNNKLNTDAAALDERLAKARKARDEKPAAGAAPAPSATPGTAQGPPPEIQREYDEAVRKGDAQGKAGNYFDAVLEYERAGRIAYNNGKIDTTALEQRLAQARKARDEGEGGEVVRFLELTVPQATSARTFTSLPSGPPQEGVAESDGTTGGDRWLVTNPYLPGNHRFFSMIYGAACSADGTLFVAANGVVPAEASRRRPRSNRDWYADNGHGLWRVAPDGRITAFSVGAYGWYPAPGLRPKPKRFCNVSVAEAAPFGPSRWGGIAIAPNGDAYISDKAYHMILKLRRDGTVEHVAGGGENACAYEEGERKREFGYRDGPGKKALFKGPRGLAIDREGNLLVADPGNCALRRIDPSGNVTTVQKGCYADPRDEQDRTKRINHIHVAVDPQGRPVVAGSLVVPSVDIYSNIHRFDVDGHVEQLLSARKGYANSGTIRVEYLSGLAFLPDGRLLIADEHNNLLRTLEGKRLSDWLGASPFTGEAENNVDGRPPRARITRPSSVCVTGDGTLFIAPVVPASGPVRKVDSKTREMSTWVY